MDLCTQRGLSCLPGSRQFPQAPVLVIVVVILAIAAKSGWSPGDVIAVMALAASLAGSRVRVLRPGFLR